MTKWVKLKFKEWDRVTRKLKECMRANRALNKQIRDLERFVDSRENR